MRDDEKVSAELNKLWAEMFGTPGSFFYRKAHPLEEAMWQSIALSEQAKQELRGASLEKLIEYVAGLTGLLTFQIQSLDAATSIGLDEVAHKGRPCI